MQNDKIGIVLAEMAGVIQQQLLSAGIVGGGELNLSLGGAMQVDLVTEDADERGCILPEPTATLAADHRQI